MAVDVTEDPSEFAASLVETAGRDPGRLLQHLIATQRNFSFVPVAAIERLSLELDIPPAQIVGAIEFYAFLHQAPRGAYDILFSDNITDRMQGSEALIGQLCRRLQVEPGAPREDGRVTVDRTSCTGMCDQGPAALINGIAVTRLDAERLDRIGDLVEAAVPLGEWPAEYFRVDNNIRRHGPLLAVSDTGEAGLRTLVAKGADGVLEAISAAGLRGRGGAGFSTATKWRSCRDSVASEHFVVCNADEGEPGTFKDRVLLDAYAEQVFEGMTVCAGVVGARRGFLYLRGEYLYLRSRLDAVLAGRRRRGLLGQSILGLDGFDFDIEIHLGAGSYVCGEESALLESLEGKRGVSRKRPPYPVVSGLYGRPTVVDNVETLVAAARIAGEGAGWFRTIGTSDSPGSKIVSVSGDCDHPGIYEYPYGVSVREVLADCGARQTQAVQISGAAGTTLNADEFDRVLAFEDLPTSGAFMVFDQRRDLLEMVRTFAHFFAHESCGFCTPCRVGGVLLRNLVDKVWAGRATPFDLEEMRALGAVMRAASHCGLGHTAPNPVLNTLDKFPEIYARRLRCSDFEPAFDLDGAVADARRLAGGVPGIGHKGGGDGN